MTEPNQGSEPLEKQTYITDKNQELAEQSEPYSWPMTIFAAEGFPINELSESVAAFGTKYIFSDILVRYDGERDLAARQSATELVQTPRCARFYEEYLRTYFGDSHIELQHIILTRNSLSESLYIFGFTDQPRISREEE